MYKGFDENGFMLYLNETFKGFDNSFLRELVRNVIDYAQKWQHVSKDQFARFVSNMLPEIEFGEVAMFCEDSILTADGQRAKHEAAARLQGEKQGDNKNDFEHNNAI